MKRFLACMLSLSLCAPWLTTRSHAIVTTPPLQAATETLAPAALMRFQISFQRHASADLLDVVIRSAGLLNFVSRGEHSHFNKKIAVIVDRIGKELRVPKPVGAYYDFRYFIYRQAAPALSYADRYQSGSTEMWIEPDGLLVIIDPRFVFRGDDLSHAGRNRFVVYASDLAHARHEAAELRATADWALRQDMVTVDDIRKGFLGDRIRQAINVPSDFGFTTNGLLLRLRGFHRAGEVAQTLDRFPDPLPTLVESGIVAARFHAPPRDHKLPAALDRDIIIRSAETMLRTLAEDFHAGRIDDARALLEEMAEFAAFHHIGRIQRAAIMEFQTVFKNWETPFRDLSSPASFQPMFSSLGEPRQLKAVFADDAYRIVVLASGAQLFLAVIEELESGLFRPAARGLMSVNSHREAAADMLFAFLRHHGLMRRAIRVLLLRGFITAWSSSDNPGPDAIRMYASFNEDPRFVVIKDMRRYRIRLRTPVAPPEDRDHAIHALRLPA